MRQGWIALPLLVALCPLAQAGDTPARHLRLQFDRIDALLVDQKWGGATAQARQLRDHMFRQAVQGRESWLGLLAAFQAVALEGSGEVDQADWMWSVARQLNAELEELDLSRYGAVGERLRNQPRVEGSPVASNHGKKIERPRPRRQPKPEFPPATRSQTRGVTLQVGCFIDTKGLPRDPKILQSGGDPLLVFSALEALGRWRFHPATVDGTPVRVFYTLTVAY